MDVRRLAAGLASAGVEPGAAVLVALANRPEALQVQLALQELGAVFVPLLAGLTAAELAYPINHSEAALLIAEPKVAELVAGLHCPPLLRVLGVDELPVGDPVARPACRPRPGLAGRDPLHLGLHRTPKGVMLRAGSRFSVRRGIADRFGVTGATTTSSRSPSPTRSGRSPRGRDVAARRAPGARRSLQPDELLGSGGRGGATYTILFPAHLNLLLEAAEGAPAHATTADQRR